jgi:hypothetical protein
MAIDLKALMRRYRWLCTACDTQGHGQLPDACPRCGEPDALYESYGSSSDLRELVDIFDDAMKWGTVH